ncbi:hypothetical protein MAPG_06406 [Magnaporthiopsis poae ATCC 64411]|uniref:Uncharacterized protein n=1 Tax=Magnaporthiopsis poae (strain ATCC 64411 / 73-15) TaxID=644358 RepID=A0A0C4E1Y1_MAGP6|nr:hypothetical protein MAPG_06406 [Magnaporthiopsis poae ATCC 64411]
MPGRSWPTHHPLVLQDVADRGQPTELSPKIEATQPAIPRSSPDSHPPLLAQNSEDAFKSAWDEKSPPLTISPSFQSVPQRPLPWPDVPPYHGRPPSDEDGGGGSSSSGSKEKGPEEIPETSVTHPHRPQRHHASASK